MSFLDELSKYALAGTYKSRQMSLPYQQKNQQENISSNKTQSQLISSKSNSSKQENQYFKANNLTDFILQLKNKLVSNIVKSWLYVPKKKKYISVTTLLSCPLQTWFKYNTINPDDIEYDKIFYLLPIYGNIGDVIHKQIYQLMDFQYIERKFYCDKYHLSGIVDIIHSNTLLDIKSSRNIEYAYDYIPQLALYYYLVTKAKFDIDKVGIWFVLLDKIIELDVGLLEELYPVYLEANLDLYESIQNETPPKYYISKECQRCLIQNKCRRFIEENNLQLNDLTKIRKEIESNYTNGIIEEVKEINNDTYSKNQRNNEENLKNITMNDYDNSNENLNQTEIEFDL